MVEKSAGIPVKVEIKTHIEQDGKAESFSFNETGQYFKMGDTVYIRYQETNPIGKIPVTMKLAGDGTAQIRRHASSDLRLVFNPNEPVTTKYSTPAGLMDITTRTKMVNFTYQDAPLNGGAQIDYELITGEEVVGQYKIRLHFTE
ncbi:DUF1934 domain-containing protein [Periweissella fabalis]|uniref:DUF1934 domain-containing protein n=1 Tax=Periweissella fabalis TaxID=1070421 RepID=A0A7X6N165_9LACO|nr:DUF1934 domain-containing protein [Periweissella fabalis]MCM0599603.1 DUF1934 domain-containing protein [Periweissella fabalis]NKZ23908.1 DUF1934 domain-containing protein [Periweissella fabalis]